MLISRRTGFFTFEFTLRRILMVFQFSISLLFIIASLVVGRQIRYMLHADMGFNSNAVITVAGFDTPPKQLQVFAPQALGIPGVQGATLHRRVLQTRPAAVPAGTNLYRCFHFRLLHWFARTHPLHRRTKAERDQHSQAVGLRRWRHHLLIK